MRTGVKRMSTLLDDDEDEDTIYKIIITPEGYYAIWPARRATPEGWWDAGFFGTKQDEETAGLF